MIGEKDIFFILLLFMGSTTIQWVRKFFLKTNEMVESPMCPNSVFKALTTCSV